MSGNPADGYEAEGIEAFDRLTTAVNGLGGRPNGLEAGLRPRRPGRGSRLHGLRSDRERHVGGRARRSHRASRRPFRRVLGRPGRLGRRPNGRECLGYASGREGGLAKGYKTAMDEKAMAAWADTPNGRLVLALDKAGGIVKLGAGRLAGPARVG